MIFLRGGNWGLKIGGKEFWELFSKNPSLIFFFTKKYNPKMLFSFFSIDAKTKKNLGVNKIVMMIGFLGKFFFFDYEIFFSTPGIDSCAYFFF